MAATLQRVSFELPDEESTQVRESIVTTRAQVLKGKNESLMIVTVDVKNPPALMNKIPPTKPVKATTFNFVFTDPAQPNQMRDALKEPTVPLDHGKNIIAFSGVSSFGRNSPTNPNSFGGKQPPPDYYQNLYCPPRQHDEDTFVFWNRLFDLDIKSLPSKEKVTQILEFHFGKLPEMTHATVFINQKTLDFFEKYMGVGRFASYFAEVIAVSTNMFTHFTSDYLGFNILTSNVSKFGRIIISNPFVSIVNPLQVLSDGATQFFDLRGTNIIEWITSSKSQKGTIIVMTENNGAQLSVFTTDGTTQTEVPIEEVTMENSQFLIDAMLFNAKFNKNRANFRGDTKEENSLLMNFIEENDGLKYVTRQNPLLAFLKQTSVDPNISLLINQGRSLQSQLNALVTGELTKFQRINMELLYGARIPAPPPALLGLAPSFSCAPELTRAQSEW
jgi:hypothetical protein